jgi:hypothetical protein
MIVVAVGPVTGFVDHQSAVPGLNSARTCGPRYDGPSCAATVGHLRSVIEASRGPYPVEIIY